jgi:hypothetical protein
MSSEKYFGGPHFSKQRITRLTTRQQNGAKNKKAALLIQQWAVHLKKENNNQKQFTEKEMEELFDRYQKPE